MDSIDMSVEAPLDLDALFADAKTPATPWPSAATTAPQARFETTLITRRRAPSSGPAVVTLGLLAIVMSALAVRASTASWHVAPEPPRAAVAAAMLPAPTPKAVVEACEREAISPSERRYPDLEAERRHVVEVYHFRQALLAKLREGQ